MTRDPDHIESFDQFIQARSIFERICDAPVEQHGELLDRLCGEDIDLREHVAELLRFDQTDKVSVDPGPITLERTELPETIGKYSIVSVLGRGGSCVVYEAKQSNPDRAVALKVIEGRSVDDEMVVRFHKEAQIMGNFSHPSIAKVYESGTVTDARTPEHYIAMELIRGVDFIEYTKQNVLSTNQKIRLFLDVCDAVIYAHKQGVIHRDLKPGNILVDADGHVKVLDFGIARVTSADTGMTTMHTQAGRVIGTLAFMSPEQLKGHAHELDERSDIYALGVILYRMLANKLPYDFETLSFYQAAKLVEESGPTRLSTVNTKLRGDIETIVSKALEREPQRRYRSVQELKDELDRYLSNKPIQARKASSWYHAKQFVRRNKGLSAGMGAAVLALVGGLIATSITLSAAIKSERLAIEKTEISEEITSFLLQDLIGQADTRKTNATDFTVVEALDQASVKIDERFKDQPLVKAEIKRLIGRTYTSLAQYSKARPQLEQSLQTYSETLGQDAYETLLTMEELGVHYTDSGAYPESLELHEELLERSRIALGPEAPLTLRVANDLGLLYSFIGDYKRAKDIHEQTLETRMRLYGEDDFNTLLSMHNLALVHLFLGEPEPASGIYERVVEGRTKLLGSDHQATLLSMNNLAGAYRDLNQYEKALEIYLRVSEAQERTLGKLHPDSLRTTANIGSALHHIDLPRAIAYYTEAYEGRLAVLGPDHRETLHSRFLMANARDVDEQEDKLAELEEVYQSQLDILGPDHRDTQVTLRAMTNLKQDSTGLDD